MIKKTFCILSLVFASAIAQLTINTPNTNWASGSDATITWSYTPGSGGGETMNLDLVGGPDDNLKSVASLASGVDPSIGSIVVKVPSNLDPATTYAIRAVMGDVLRFTARFNVAGGSSVITTETSQASISNSPPTTSTTSVAAESSTVSSVPTTSRPSDVNTLPDSGAQAGHSFGGMGVLISVVFSVMFFTVMTV